MRIEGLQVTGSHLSLREQVSAPEKGSKSFSQVLSDAVEQVNDLQKQADVLATQAATGDLEDVHQAMIAMEKAVLALEFAVQVRNKAIEAYQELMRTQV
jgi:flagellar hook-basal body complex protein FliE